MTKDTMLKALSEWLAKEGLETISLVDYKAKPNVPVKDMYLRRAFGTWTRVLDFMNKRHPVQVAPPPAPKAAPKPAPKPAPKVAPKPKAPVGEK
jgi:hypothetical protein